MIFIHFCLCYISPFLNVSSDKTNGSIEKTKAKVHQAVVYRNLLLKILHIIQYYIITIPSQQVHLKQSNVMLSVLQLHTPFHNSHTICITGRILVLRSYILFSLQIYDNPRNYTLRSCGDLD